MAFADASLVAQAAVVYGVTQGEDGRLQSRLICSRNKVSALRKQETVARLELQAALMAVELTREVGIAYQIDLNTPQFFTDSTTVLWWLRSTKALPVFVANRVTKILDGSDVKQWYHVRTHENPADLPTRGMVPNDLLEEELWWHGPSFLLVHEDEWPEQPAVVETEVAKGEILAVGVPLGTFASQPRGQTSLSAFSKDIVAAPWSFFVIEEGNQGHSQSSLLCTMTQGSGA